MALTRLYAAIALCVLALAPPTTAHAQEAHGSGQMSMSADGQYIAFTALGVPSSQFVLVHAPTQRATIIQGPLPHIGDLAWSADGDELTFVTSDTQTLSGEGRHVWRLRVTPQAPAIDLLAIIPNVRSPVLSADGRRLATFEGVTFDGARLGASQRAFAIFERSLSDGVAVRRSAGHYLLGGDLSYDRAGAIYTRANHPVFAQTSVIQGMALPGWVNRDAQGRWSYQWSRDIRGIFSFRILPGETQEEWPLPYPAAGVEHGGSFVQALDDGRVVLLTSSNPLRTADWYDARGMPRRPDRSPSFDYVAYEPDGAAEILIADALPEGRGRTGGADISSDGRYFAQVTSVPGERRESALMYFENGVLQHETSLTDIMRIAQTITFAASSTPVMAVPDGAHHWPAPPPNQ
ncbi:MAG: hypothetical protein AB7G40_09245 [Hyphomonadaceae bacterium]